MTKYIKSRDHKHTAGIATEARLANPAGFAFGVCPLPDMPPLFRPPGARSRADQNRAYDRRRYSESETRRLYGTRRWKNERDDHLRRERFCRLCKAAGELTLATVRDHIEPHNGDVEKFWAGPFQSLCDHHHNSVKQAEEAAARRARRPRG